METLKSGAFKLGINLTLSQLAQFETYYRELSTWNKRLNLTRISGCEETQVKHFLDSLTVVLGMRRGDKQRVIDVGSGAGLPGIPLKIALPDIALVLLEATAKKVRFLEHIVKKLGLKEAEVVAGRAEEVAHKAVYREQFDLVLARAVALLPSLVELALPFCATGGRFIAQKKGHIAGEVARSHHAIELLGGRLVQVKPVVLEGLRDDRLLVIIEKTGVTPPAYPRRPGMPAKRPLTAG
jgi:16S rRNA (guanine527-N7)-methyltransferase